MTSQNLSKHLLNTSFQTILWNTVATECQGNGDLLNNLRIKNTVTGEEKDLPVNGLFYAIGTTTPPLVGAIFFTYQCDP
jgi:thioredoxin reductase (NADPH)